MHLASETLPNAAGRLVWPKSSAGLAGSYMSAEEARIRLDEHDRYCEMCSLSKMEPNQGRCERGKMLVEAAGTRT